LLGGAGWPSYSCLNQFADFAINFLDVELFGGGTGGSNYDTPPCVPCSEPEPDKNPVFMRF